MLTLTLDISVNRSFFSGSRYGEHKDVNPQRIENTCGWFLNHLRFQEWRQRGRNDVLWVSADPGCGKSVLSRSLVDESLTHNGSATTCYFFFKNNADQNQITTAVCALLNQLFRHGRGEELFRKFAIKAIEEDGEKLKDNFGLLWELFIAVASDPAIGDVICILDALDECQQPDRDTIILRLRQFHEKFAERWNDSGYSLKFLVTIRPYGDIQRVFGGKTIRLAGEKESTIISQEIALVMDKEIDQIASERNLSAETREGVKLRLAATPNRTYLWLYLMLKELRTCLGTTEKKLLQVIDRLPATVEQYYEQILQRCSETNKRHTKNLLEVIVAASRPLTLDEIDIILEIHPNVRSYDSLDLEGKVNRETWIREACGLFVVIFESRVRLIHETAKEFLLQQPGRRAATHGWKASISLNSGHFVLCTRCITYLLFDDFPMSETRNSPWLLTTSPSTGLLNYAANNWFLHMQNTHFRDREWVAKSAKLCKWSSTWLWACDMEISSFSSPVIYSQVTRRLSPINIAMRYGLLQVMELLLLQIFDVNLTDLAMEAVKGNHFSVIVVPFLLDRKGANIQITAELFLAAGNPTYSTCSTLQKILLDRITTITAELLQAITETFGADIIKMLLIRGAKVTITREMVIVAKGSRCLREKSENTIKTLIDQEELDKFITKEGFVEVFRQCSSEVVKLLLNRTGSHPEITDEIFKAASSNPDGHKIFQLLLDGRSSFEITENGVLDVLRHSNGSMLSFLLRTGKLNLVPTKEVMTAVARSSYALPLMEHLLDLKGADTVITSELFVVASTNRKLGEDLMKLLIERKGTDTEITEEVIRAVATRPGSAEATLKRLFHERGVTSISDEELNLIKKTAMFPPIAEPVIKFLHDLRGTNIVITKEMIVRVAQFPASREALTTQVMRSLRTTM